MSWSKGGPLEYGVDGVQRFFDTRAAGTTPDPENDRAAPKYTAWHKRYRAGNRAGGRQSDPPIGAVHSDITARFFGAIDLVVGLRLRCPSLARSIRRAQKPRHVPKRPTARRRLPNEHAGGAEQPGLPAPAPRGSFPQRVATQFGEPSNNRGGPILLKR